eukprot:m51a1_g887 hypothetical protein (497) ;mRNA; f:2830-4592
MLSAAALVACLVGSALSLDVRAVAASRPHIVSYVDALPSWWPASAIAAGLGVPGYAPNDGYNVINLAFWTTGATADAAQVWANALQYVSTDNPWGQTNDAVQKAWADAFHKAGKLIMVSAFGATDFPTSAGKDPVQVAQALAEFVNKNNLDGVDLDWEDNNAMEAGTGEAWLVSCTRKLRELLPNKIITHAPQGPYFMGAPKYKNGGYVTVHNQVGSLIDWYNMQFYNQESTTYNTYETLFIASNGWSTGTSVKEIAAKGVPLDKLVVGKPVMQKDATNTGYVELGALKSILQQGINNLGWCAGVMGWQYPSDISGTSNTWSNGIKSLSWTCGNTPDPDPACSTYALAQCPARCQSCQATGKCMETSETCGTTPQPACSTFALAQCPTSRCQKCATTNACIETSQTCPTTPQPTACSTHTYTQCPSDCQMCAWTQSCQDKTAKCSACTNLKGSQCNGPCKKCGTECILLEEGCPMLGGSSAVAPLLALAGCVALAF